MKVNKKIKLQLVGLDGNAFSVMGTFQRQARKEKLTQEEIDIVLKETTSGDYNHLLATIVKHCEDYGMGEEEDEMEKED